MILRSVLKGLVTVAFTLSMLPAQADAQDLRTVSPQDCMPELGDYTHMWWADGFRGRSEDGRWLRCIQTGQYAMAMDVENMQITRLGAIKIPLSYSDAAAQDNGVLETLPPADLRLTATVDGEEYRCVQGGRHMNHSGPRLVESGRFVQRADITDLVFENEGGRRLSLDARFEIVAWPDRMALLLDAAPGRQEPAAGDCFGRVGGGFYFDGSNHIEVPPSADLEPENLTLELWVYVPEGQKATTAEPWLVCKNGNEWAEGNYGIMLIHNAPVAFLNIGGGRENMHVAPPSSSWNLGRDAAAPLKREQWHHLAMTYDGSDLRLYVDGQERSSQQVGKVRVPEAGGLAIGRRQDNSGDGYHFRGAMDEIRIYMRALTADEIKAHAQSPEAVAPDPALAQEWLFDPEGVASEQRPSPRWTDAELCIQLESQGHVFANAARATEAEPWVQGRRLTAAISIVPKGNATATPTPAVVEAVTIPDGSPRAVEHDLARDWYRVDLDGIEPAGEHNDALERVKVTLRNPSDSPRVIRLLFDKNGGGVRAGGFAVMTGFSPLLRDLDGNPLGIPVQISKNWHAQPDRDILYQGAWLHGFTMLRLPARSQTELEFDLAYAHWGGVAAASHAQLCLIGWGSNQLWDQSAIGSWGESICYEPDQAQAAAAVLDVRPLMVHCMGRDEPVQWHWTNNVGGADFFRYFDAAGNRQFPARMKTAYLRQGPVLTEVMYAGRSQDGKLEHRETVSLYRTNDITRGVYRLRLDVKEPTDFSRLVFFQVGADSYSYTGERGLAVGNETGLLREWDAQWGGETYRTEPIELTGRVPWISMHRAASRDTSAVGAWANRGIVLRHWDARLGGTPASAWVAEHGVKARGTDTSTMDFLPPPGVDRLVPGDYVEATFEHIIMPQYAKDYYGPNANLKTALEQSENTWALILREAVGNDIGVKVSRGTLELTRPVRIRAAVGTQAEFTLEGGLGYVPVTITGLASHRRPVLETRDAAGAWQVVDQSVHGSDFWQANHVAADNTWQVTYTLPLDTPGDERTVRAFRFRLATGE